jgi:hypothetical protein
MAFDQSTITEANATRSGASLVVSWTSTAPAGTVFQVYLGGKRVWSGTARRVSLPAPARSSRVDVGAVGPTEGRTDFSGSLPAMAGGGDRVILAWKGGDYLSPADGVTAYRVFGEATPGGGISYAGPVATIAVGAGGSATAGFGMGGFGSGGFGQAQSSYSWESGPLTSGTWHWAIAAIDAVGNVGTTTTVSATITAPPGPPAANADGKRLTFSYDQTSRVATLGWLPSPG